MARFVEEIDVDLPHPALPGADWADAFRVATRKRFANARTASEAAFANFPAWVNALMALRNLIVTPFGLKTGEHDRPPKARIGFFPLLSETETEVVVGMNDRHLDFRCVVDLAEKGAGQEITIATVIHRHNWLGRAYLIAVMPFHRMIVCAALARVARTD